MILARSEGANILICSGVIVRTLTNIAYKPYVTISLDKIIEEALPFDLRASSGGAGVMPLRPALELAAPQEVADEVGEGIPGSGGSEVRVDRDVERGILGIAAVVAVAA